MKLRTWINQNAAIATVLAVLALVGSILALLYVKDRGSVQTAETYYLDLGSTAPNPVDRLFAAEIDTPPVNAPSGVTMPNGGPAGVKAHVFSCGDCADRSSWFIGYLETTTPEFREAMIQFRENQRSGKPSDLPSNLRGNRGRLVSAPDPVQWVEFASGPGQTLISIPMSRCGEVPPQPCEPSK
jgi:hypothetical protein